MLRDNIKLVVPTVLDLNAQGISVKAKRDTSLAILVNGASGINQVTESEDVISLIASVQDEYSQDGGHEVNLQTIADGLATKIRSHTTYAGSVAIPLIRDITKAALSKKSEIEGSSGLAFDIEYVTKSPIYGMESLIHDLRDITPEDKPIYRDIDVEFRSSLLEGLTLRELKTTMTITGQAYEKNIDNVFRTFGDNVAFIKEAILSDKKLPTSRMDIHTEHCHLLTYLFLRGLQAGQHPNISYSDMGSIGVSESIDQLHASRTRLAHQLFALEIASKSSQFIISADYDDMTAKVQYAAYMGWLSSGGSGDILKTALAIGKENESSYAMLNSTLSTEEGRKKVESKIESCASKEKAKQAYTATSAIGRFIVDAVHHHNRSLDLSPADLQERSDAIVAFCKDNVLTPETAIDDYVKSLVCAVVIRNGTTRYILDAIQTRMSGDDGVDHDTALTLCAISILAKSIAAQLELCQTPAD